MGAFEYKEPIGVAFNIDESRHSRHIGQSGTYQRILLISTAPIVTLSNLIHHTIIQLGGIIQHFSLKSDNYFQCAIPTQITYIAPQLPNITSSTFCISARYFYSEIVLDVNYAEYGDSYICPNSISIPAECRDPYYSHLRSHY